MPATYSIFSDPEDLLNDVKLIEQTYTTHADAIAFAVERITQADRHVRFQLSNIVNFDLVKYYDDSPVTTPYWLSELSSHKAAELSYVRLGSIKRNLAEQDDRVYWQEVYEGHILDIKMGKVPLVDSTGASVAYGVHTIPTPGATLLRPYQGFGKWGTEPSADDLEAEREAGLEQ